MHKGPEESILNLSVTLTTASQTSILNVFVLNQRPRRAIGTGPGSVPKQRYMPLKQHRKRKSLCKDQQAQIESLKGKAAIQASMLKESLGTLSK